MRARTAALALALAACTSGSETPPAPPDGGLVVRPDLRLAWQAGLPRLPATSTTPPSYLEAAQTWRTATTAFSIGAYDDASRAFMAVAGRLRGGEGPALGQTFRAARCMAYENAAKAYVGAQDPEEGIVALAKARVRDPSCQHSITRALDRLSSQTGTVAPAAPLVAPEAPKPPAER